jgi:hypothetical protein
MKYACRRFLAGGCLLLLLCGSTRATAPTESSVMEQLVAEEDVFSSFSDETCAVIADDGSCLVYASHTATPKLVTRFLNAYNDEDEDDIDLGDDSDLDDYDLDEQPPESCVDTHERCPDWATMGECEANPAYMERYCPYSCNACDQLPYEHVTKYGEPQTVDPERFDEMEPLLNDMDDYMYQIVFVDPKYSNVKDQVRMSSNSNI